MVADTKFALNTLKSIKQTVVIVSIMVLGLIALEVASSSSEALEGETFQQNFFQK